MLGEYRVGTSLATSQGKPEHWAGADGQVCLANSYGRAILGGALMGALKFSRSVHCNHLAVRAVYQLSVTLESTCSAAASLRRGV